MLSQSTSLQMTPKILCYMERAHVKLLFKYQDFYQGKHGINVSKTGMERLEREEIPIKNVLCGSEGIQPFKL